MPTDHPLSINYTIQSKHAAFMYLKVHLHSCVHMCMCEQLMKRGLGFERKQGRVYESVWKEEREWEMMYL